MFRRPHSILRRRRYTLIAFVAALTAALVLPAPGAVAEKPEKTVVCHLTGNGTYRAIEIAKEAVEFHLVHGDSMGATAFPDLGYGPCEDSNGNGILDVDEKYICVSINGVEVLKINDGGHQDGADCDSIAPEEGKERNIAIAHGHGSYARAGLFVGDSGNTASADGYNSFASAVIGDENTALYTGKVDNCGFSPCRAVATGGDGNTATVNGDNSRAFAGDGDGNTATVDGDTSLAFAREGDGNTATIKGDNSRAFAEKGDGNTARVDGNKSRASALDGDGNTATVEGNNSDAFAWFGDDNTATVEGNDSVAEARSPTGCTAEAIGDGVTDFCS